MTAGLFGQLSPEKVLDMLQSRRRSREELSNTSEPPAPVQMSISERSVGDSYLDELVVPEIASVDLVAVHGLNPGKENHGERAWTKNQVLWLSDPKFLPKALPNARVLLYAYNSEVTFNTTTSGVSDVARDLLNRLKVARRGTTDRPIVFLCHSLGGIVVKKALVRAKGSEIYENIQHMTRGIAFFATPHRGGGSHANLGRVIAGVVKTVTGNVKNSLMETLQHGSTIAQDIQEDFEQQAQAYQIVSFYETKPFRKHTGLVVDKASAKLGLSDSIETVVGVAENHSGICKFDNVNDGNYRLVMDQIEELVQKAMSISSHLPVIDPSIPPPDYETLERRVSVTSLRSDGSLSLYSGSSASVRFGMPTWTSDDLSSDSSAEQTREGSKERPGPVLIIPYNENPHFTGRENILEDVKQSLLSTENHRKRMALYGLGGVGKSQIAINFVFWYRRKFPDHSVFWIHAGTAGRFRQDMLEIGIRCRIPGLSNSAQDRLALIRDWLERKKNTGWLMVVDNADDLQGLTESDDGGTQREIVSLSRYIPRHEQGRVLVTTRDLKTGRDLGCGNVIRVEPMSTTESTDLLHIELDQSTSDGPSRNGEIDLLASALDHLPLAMVQATSFIKENSMSITSYLKLIDEESQIVQTLKHEFEESEPGRDSAVPNAVYSTWKLSIEQIGRDNPSAAELLFLMACLEQSKIPSTLLESSMGGSSIEFRKAVGMLLRFSLVSSGSEDSYNMHRLMQLVVRQWLRIQDLEQRYLNEAMLLIANSFPSGEPETFKNCQAFEPHAVKMLQIMHSSNEGVAARALLQMNLAWYYFKRNRWPEAESMARGSCTHWEQAHGTKHRGTLQAKAKLGRILDEAAKGDEAEFLAKLVLDGTKSLLGLKDNQTLEAYHFLGKVYQGQGKSKLAEEAARKALEGRQKILPPSHPDIIRSQRRLATILELQGKYHAAEALIKTALEGHQALAGPTNSKTLDCQYRLAFIQRALGRYAAAEETVRACFETQKAVYGLSNLDTRKAQYSLALSLIAQSKFDEAESYILDLQEYSKTGHRLDPSHSYVLYLQYALGQIKSAQGRHKEALALYKVACEGIERLKPGHPTSLDFRSTYAAALLKVNAVAYGEESYASQQDIHRALVKALGSDHPLTLTSLVRLSEAAAARGDREGALKAAKKASERRAKVLGSQHPDTIASKAWVERLAKIGQAFNSRQNSASKKAEGGESQRKKWVFDRWRKTSGNQSRNEDDSTEGLAEGEGGSDDDWDRETIRGEDLDQETVDPGKPNFQMW